MHACILCQVALMVKNLLPTQETSGSIAALGRSPGGGHGNPLQYSCLRNAMYRGAWQAMAHSIARSWTRLKQLNTYILLIFSSTDKAYLSSPILHTIEWMNELVAQLCPILCNPMDCSPPGSSVHRMLQASIPEWVAISFSRGSSWPRDWAWVSCIEADSSLSMPPEKQLCLTTKGTSQMAQTVKNLPAVWEARV